MLGADLARVLDRARGLQEQWGDKFISAEHLLQVSATCCSGSKRRRDGHCVPARWCVLVLRSGSIL